MNASGLRGKVRLSWHSEMESGEMSQGSRIKNERCSSTQSGRSTTLHLRSSMRTIWVTRELMPVATSRTETCRNRFTKMHTPTKSMYILAQPLVPWHRVIVKPTRRPASPGRLPDYRCTTGTGRRTRASPTLTTLPSSQGRRQEARRGSWGTQVEMLVRHSPTSKANWTSNYVSRGSASS
jgi:hypothetical protein